MALQALKLGSLKGGLESAMEKARAGRASVLAHDSSSLQN